MKFKQFHCLMMIGCISAAFVTSECVAGTVPLEFMETTYKISGINSRLVDRNSPTTVTFDGKPERVGLYVVDESIHSAGPDETWVDFEFTRDYPIDIFDSDSQARRRAPRLPAESGMPLAGDPNGMWAVELTDLEFLGQTAQDTPITGFYMYFTRQGEAVDFGDPNANSLEAHPFEDNITVLSSDLRPLEPGELPPGASNGLVTTFNNYLNYVHNSMDGLRLPNDVDGFHIGYRVEVPEPSTCVLATVGMLGMGWPRRSRKRT
jgi:hypothetical protein